MNLLTVTDVAQRVRLSVRQIWKLKSTGQIPTSVSIGRTVRWRASDIATWVELGCPDRATFEAAAKKQLSKERNPR